MFWNLGRTLGKTYNYGAWKQIWEHFRWSGNSVWVLGNTYKFSNLGRNSVVFCVSYGQIVEVDTFFQDFSEHPTNSGNFIKAQGAPDRFNGLERSSGSYVWVHGTEFKFR